MPLDFPNSPTNGTSFPGPGGVLWSWDGAKWVAAGTTTTSYAPLNSPLFTGDPKAPTPLAGDADTSLATTAFVQAAVAPALNGIGRNLLHNPLFNVAQRGAGLFMTNGYTLDRWRIEISLDSSSVGQAVATDAARAGIGDETANFIAAFSVTGNAGAASYTGFRQPIENVRRLAGKTVTVSFWAAANSGTPKIGVSIDQYFGTGGSPSAGVLGNGQSVTIGTAWARYSLTFAVPSTAGKTLGTNNDHYTNLWFWLSAGTSLATRAGNIGVQTCAPNIWGVQLEIGSVATPLEKPDPRYDLANCQRFYQGGIFSIQGYAGASVMQQTLLLPVSMRATPTITPTWTSQSNCSSSGAGPLNNYGIEVHTTTGAGPQFVLAGSFTASADL